jgi:hypothetical protein
MARRVYFAFHFDRDNWRVNQVRNLNKFLGAERAGFYDDSEWSEAKIYDPDTIRRQIRARIERTTVTVVLVGDQTWQREWVREEIAESVRKGNGVLPVYIHHLEDANGHSSPRWVLPQLPWLPAATPTPFLFDGQQSQQFAGAIERAGKVADAHRTPVPPAPFGFGGATGLGILGRYLDRSSTPKPEEPTSFAEWLIKNKK